ncbi:Zinc finger homeobox protein 3 [Tupaia chinensis]|uniref:Zinc finger homeobox protein 3 n=1 Tax=Tupaia chinensis TaxID=246437 RepID=L9KPI0_TUPCH|nr:Zinc finger homeobox protein 3 [Tupaia chinensis]
MAMAPQQPPQPQQQQQQPQVQQPPPPAAQPPPTPQLPPQQSQQQRKDKDSEKGKEKEKAHKGKGEPLPVPKKEKGEAPSAYSHHLSPAAHHGVCSGPCSAAGLAGSLDFRPHSIAHEPVPSLLCTRLFSLLCPPDPWRLAERGAASPEKAPAKESPKPEEQKNAPREVSPLLPKPPEEPEAESKSADSLYDPFIVPKVQYKLVCRKCQAGFGDEEAARSHLKSLCFFGQSVVNLQGRRLVPLPGVRERALWGGSSESTSRVGLAQTQNNHESSKKRQRAP